MRTRFRGRPATLAAAFGAAVLASCTSDAPTRAIDRRPTDAIASPVSGMVDICHHAASGAMIIRVAAAALPAHLAQGDYLTTLSVSHDPAAPIDDAHFERIGDALAAARAGRLNRGELVSADCRITIDVAPGIVRGTANQTTDPSLEHFPLIVDVPDISLQGALQMRVDDDGRATGDGVGDAATTVTPADPLPIVNGVSTPIIIANGHPGASAGNGLTVAGFVFQSGHAADGDAGGQGLLAIRVAGLTIRGNRFEGGFTEAMDLRASSADVLTNHLSGDGGTCDICLAGPGSYRAEGNRILAGGIEGILDFATVNLPLPDVVEPFVLPASAETWADVSNNEVRDHQRLPVGAGIRVGMIGTSAPNVHGIVHTMFRNNLVSNNRFGMIVDAGFPVAGTDLEGDADLAFHGNIIEQSCEAPLLVSLSRHTTALGLANAPYLMNSTFRLSLNGDLNWTDVWFSHPAGFGNTLIVDGVSIPNGSRQFYDATKVCP